MIMKNFIIILLVCWSAYTTIDALGYLPQFMSLNPSRSVQQSAPSGTTLRADATGSNTMTLSSDFGATSDMATHNTNDSVPNKDSLKARLSAIEASIADLKDLLAFEVDSSSLAQSTDTLSTADTIAATVDSLFLNSQELAELASSTRDSSDRNISKFFSKSDFASISNYRIFPYSGKIQYQTKEVLVDKPFSNYTSGHMRSCNDSSIIYINHFVPTEEFKASADWAVYGPIISGLNSLLNKKLTLCHEYTHLLNQQGIPQRLSSKDQLLLNKYNEISACLSELLLAREFYLQAGATNFMDEKLNFYFKAVSEHKIEPNRTRISPQEAEFIINGITEYWQQNLAKHYIMKGMFNTIQQDEALLSTFDMSQNQFLTLVGQFFAYEINGQKINFLEYLKTDIKLSEAENKFLEKKNFALKD